MNPLAWNPWVQLAVFGPIAWFAAGLLVAGWFWLGGIGTPDDHEIENQRWDR